MWSIDFMIDALYQGRRFRTFNVLDEAVREALSIEIDTSFPALRVTRALEQLQAWRGLPNAIRLDNGPEFTALSFTEWCAEKGITLRYIQPGKTNQNAFIERFNRSYRNEVLNGWVFESLDQVREMTLDTLTSYNEERPHDALGNLPPTLFRELLHAKRLLLNCLLDGEAYDSSYNI